MSVEVLRKKLADLKAEGRFGGRAYPGGMERFTRVLSGQGFFPGGDGLWRDPDALDRPSPYPFPVGGIMFLGNDFGTCASFPKEPKCYEKTATWRRMRDRVEIAGVLGSCGFYTNAFLGLRSIGRATGKRILKNPSDEPAYDTLCAEYLEFQIRTQMPRLIVALGPEARRLLGPRIGLPNLRKMDEAQQARFEGRHLLVLAVDHPFSDIPSGKSAEEGERLAAAWGMA